MVWTLALTLSLVYSYDFCSELSIMLIRSDISRKNAEGIPQLSLSASRTITLNLILFLITAFVSAGLPCVSAYWLWYSSRCARFCEKKPGVNTFFTQGREEGQLFPASSSAQYPHCWSFHSLHVLTYSFHKYIGTQSTSKPTAAQLLRMDRVSVSGACEQIFWNSVYHSIIVFCLLQGRRYIL